MSNSVLGIIFSNMHDEDLQELTANRTMGSVPFGGRYRLIDFILSNMYNSGITKVGVITKSNYQSLMDHLGSGKEWDLSHKRDGLYILPPFGRSQSGIYKSRLDALMGITDFIRHSANEYVVMSDCDNVCNMDLNRPLEFHIQSGADVTAVYRVEKITEARRQRVSAYSVDEKGKVDEIVIHPDEGEYNIGMNIWIVRRQFLLRILSEASSRGWESWERDVLQKGIGRIRIFGWKFDGYAGTIDSIQNYFSVSMDLLRRDVRQDLFYRFGHIYTKVRDEVPAKYESEAAVSDSFIADGCTIEGQVEHSILFRGAHVGRGAKVANSIIMQSTHIGGNVRLNYIIIDKDANINDNRVLMGFDTYPLYIAKGSIV